MRGLNNWHRRLVKKMTYTLTHFRSWMSNFSSWEDLRTWLQSEDGGKLRVIEPKNSPYALVRYVKGQSDFTKEHVGWCRSVIVNKETRRVMSVAPPKASAITESTLSEAIVAEEFVDGTMINLFRVSDTENVELATRSRINANSRFYEGGPSFAEMLQEVMNGAKLSSIVECVDPAYAEFTSVVLQHPKNRIVKRVDKPTFVILHQGWVDEDGRVIIKEDSADFHTEGEHSDTIALPYKLERISGAKSVEAWVAEQAQTRGFGWQGVVIKDGKGKRWRVRSQVYETVRRIRGNESTVEERYARLRKERTMNQYLAFYPEDREVLYEIEGRLRANTRQLLRFYGDVFRARKTPYHELPWPYKHHVSVLHNEYKEKLKALKQTVDMAAVVSYVNTLELADLANMMKKHSYSLVEAKPNVAEDAKGVETELFAPTPA
jgi:hypothetical protein